MPTPEPTRTPTIETDRLRLDPLAPDDADEMTPALSDPELYRFIGGAPPTVDELRGQYAAWIAGPSRAGEAWHNWAIRLAADGAAIGHVQATVVDDGGRADIAWILGTRWQGRGYATEAAIAMVRWLESDGVGTITAHVHPQHAASARVAERAGLEPTDEVEGGEVVWRRLADGRRSSET
jgi:RimJ/RimL family protein N-acetyltransferase